MIPRSRIEFPDRADLVSSIPGNTDVPVALEDDLDVFNVKCVRTTELGHFAGSCGDVVDEFVDKF